MFTNGIVRWTASGKRTLVLAAVLLAPILFYSGSGRYAHGGSWLGLAYGVLGTAMIALLVYYGARKRTYAGHKEPLATWLVSHKNLGYLALLVILCHSGLRLNDTVAVTTFISLILIVLSGVAGHFLYKYVPAKLITVAADPSMEDLSREINNLAQAMQNLATGKSAGFQSLHERLDPEKLPCGAAWRILLRKCREEILQSGRARLNKQAIRELPVHEISDFNLLLAQSARVGELRLQLVRKQFYINLMAVWLYVHIPLTVVMMIALIAHVVGALSYLSWENSFGLHF